VYKYKCKSLLQSNSTVGFGWVENLIAYIEGIISVECVWW